MLISTKGRYALRVMIDLARQKGDRYTTLTDLAAEEALSEKYLESILTMLTREGLLLALRGKGGGYRLAKPAEDYDAREILEAVEGTLAPVACMREGRHCERAGSCATLPLWSGLDQVIGEYLRGWSLARLAEAEV